MTTLYKYSGNLGDAFFDDPTIKISVTSKLNDPFESRISENIKEYINRCFKKKIPHKVMESSTWMIETFATVFGIVSLSETHRNSLMWAHYANEHSGMCIGIDSSYLQHKADEFINIGHDTLTLKGEYHPIKIKYDNMRFDPEEHELIPTSDFANGSAFRTLLIKQLSIKSDEWIYEKEHRSIIPFSYADIICIKRDALEDITKNDLGDLTESGILTAIESDHPTIEKYECTDRKIKRGFAIIAAEAPKDAVSFLCRIPHEKILTIHLGVNYDETSQNNLLKKIKQKTHPLHHVKVYRKKLSNSRFELNSELIYTPKQ